ncbi:hypothetical protein EUGRSUZ_H03747 [Eucalyptus grandis]|uniref:Uncharacterized protein n=2 Tax=Eucalyptus grandis TaxID=71139 RepID=A0ACC3JUK3_EUCGR|nr:hypothetical protein EUGRSUZ_H03747 [Eucalyptus grandis]
MHDHKLFPRVQTLDELRKGVLLSGICKCYGEVINEGATAIPRLPVWQQWLKQHHQNILSQQRCLQS